MAQAETVYIITVALLQRISQNTFM